MHNCSVSTPLKLQFPLHYLTSGATMHPLQQSKGMCIRKKTALLGCQGLFQGCLFIPYRASFPGTLYALCTYSALFRGTFFHHFFLPQSTTQSLSLNQDVLLISVFIFSQSFALVSLPRK